MKKKSLAAMCALLCLPLLAPVLAQDVKPAFKSMDVFDLQWVTDPQIAPDGKTIAYVRTGFDVKTDRSRGAIWLTDTDGKHEHPLSGAVQSGSPRWSPDGSRIAYFAPGADGSVQLFMYWMQTGVSAAISNYPEPPHGLTWSRDGRWLALIMAVPAEHRPLKVELPEPPKDAKWDAPLKIIDRMVYRHDGEGYLANTFDQVFVVSADGGAARQITHGDFENYGPPSFTADGKALLVSANRRADADYEPLDSEIYRIDLADESIHALTDRRGPDRGPVTSPDGKRVAYLGYDDQYLGFQAAQLYVMDADGGKSHSLTARLDRNVVAPKWTLDGKRIVFQYEDHGSAKLASVDLDGNLKTLADGVGGNDVARPYSGGTFSISDTGRFAYMRSAPLAPPALATGSAPGDVKTLTALSDNLLSRRTLGAVEEINFSSSADHRKIQGWIVKPPNFDPTKKYPLLLEIHGGPFAAYEGSFAAEMQLYAAAGYVVLYLNPRGSTGYGEDFANLIHHAYPSQDYDDLMSGVDAVIGRGYVDSSRLFVTGGSGGGVLTAWIVGHTNRFRAAVVVKPVINWTSFVLTGDQTNFFARYWFEGFPWDHQDTYWKRSPLAYVGSVTTPTMVMTGEADLRTPSSEAEQFYQALKLRRVDTALVRVPNASHDISARPSHLIASVQYVIAWFKAHDAK